MIEKIKKFKILAGAVLLILLLSIPITIVQLKKQQETRSRASGEAISVILDPLTKNVNAGGDLDIAVKLNTRQNNVSAVDITFVFDPTHLESQLGVAKFTFSSPFTLIKSDGVEGNIHSVGVNLSSTPVTGGSVTIGTIHLKAKTPGTTTIGFSNIHVNASGVASALPIDTENTKNGTYTITNASLTSTPGDTASPTPTSSASPTPTPTRTPGTPTPTRSVTVDASDLNDDGIISELDLIILQSGLSRRSGD